MKDTKNVKFDLQLFAEEGEGAQVQAGSVTEASDPKPAGVEKVKFSPEQQAEVDRIVQSRLAREMDKWQSDAKKKADDAREAEKLKNMSESERTAKRIKDMEAKLAALESEKKESAMITAAREELQKKGYAFSETIVRHLIGETAEETKGAIDQFSADFEKAVQEAVKKAIPSAEPKGSRTKSGTTLTRADIMAITDKKERQKAIRDNMHLFKK